MSKSKKTSKSHQAEKHWAERYGLAACLLVASLAGILLYRVVQQKSMPGQASVTHDRSSKKQETATFISSGPAVDYSADVAGKIELKDLGLTITLDPELSRQGLVGTPGRDPNYPSKSVTFSSKELAAKNSACIDNSVRGWIGTLTRYEGSSASMPDHELHHTTAILDFPGFHTSYRSVTQLCPERAPGFAASDLTQERDVAGQLWQAIRAAKYLKP